MMKPKRDHKAYENKSRSHNQRRTRKESGEKEKNQTLQLLKFYRRQYFNFTCLMHERGLFEK